MNRVLGLLGFLGVLAACERSNAPAPERTSGAAGVPPSVAVTVFAAWDDRVGAVVATPSAETGSLILFMRDTASTADLDVELFNHEPRTTRAVLRPAGRTRGCAWQRSADLSLAGTASYPVTWSLALSPDVAMPIAVDPVKELLPRDSAALVATISKLVSALPEDSTSTIYRGLPIVVRDAWQFTLPDDRTPVVVAITARSLNTESNPRSELVMIIAEPEQSATGPWRIAFTHRDAGSEDRVEGADLLAALRLRSAHGAVALAYDNERGTQLELVERRARGVWRVRWSSALLTCAKTP